MISIVDGFFWLLLLLLLLQPPFGTSRQFLISSAIRSVLRFASGMVISLATVRASSARSRQYFGSLIGTLAMGLAPRTDHGDDRARSWRRSRSRWFPTVRQPGGWPPRLPPSRR